MCLELREGEEKAGNEGGELDKSLKTMVRSLNFILCPKGSLWRIPGRNSHNRM